MAAPFGLLTPQRRASSSALAVSASGSGSVGATRIRARARRLPARRRSPLAAHKRAKELTARNWNSLAFLPVRDANGVEQVHFGLGTAPAQR